MISLRQTPTASCRAGSRPVAKSLSLGSQQIGDGSRYGVVDEETRKDDRDRLGVLKGAKEVPDQLCPESGQRQTARGKGHGVL